MQIISKKKKRRTAARIGFLWFWLKSLPVGDFAIATEVLCDICNDLGLSWEDVHRAATHMAEATALHRKVGTDNENP